MKTVATLSVRCSMVLTGILVACMTWRSATEMSSAQEPIADSASPQRWAVLLVGLQGDDEHEASFRETADRLQAWLTGPLEFPAEHVLRLPAPERAGDPSANPLTAETMRSKLSDIKQKLRGSDTLWVILVGHGNYDGKQAWFHVAGKDPSNEDVGRWMADIRCREQVIWLTHSSSGWFVKPLSRQGRVVIAATATDDESNETEFPHALATVAQRPAAEVDIDRDGAVSVAELYTATVNEVLRRIQSDNRLPTEHAQIDDNGDGVGTEEVLRRKTVAPAADLSTPPNAKVDGDLARRTRVPYRVSAPPSETQRPVDPR